MNAASSSAGNGLNAAKRKAILTLVETGDCHAQAALALIKLGLLRFTTKADFEQGAESYYMLTDAGSAVHRQLLSASSGRTE